MVLLVLAGPTGIGKTDLSIKLAKHFDTEIVSADSRQFYKELEIGTAPPSERQLSEVKHHFIKCRSITDDYTAGKYEIDASKVIAELSAEKKHVWLVGGSGLYIDAVCRGIDDIPATDPELRKNIVEKYRKEGIEGLRFELKRLDPDAYNIIDIRNPQRLTRALEVRIATGKSYVELRKNFARTGRFRTVKICLELPREALYARIDSRVDRMMNDGLRDEAKRLYRHRNLNALKTVGYRELFDCIDNKIDSEEALRLIKRNTRRYAKRQISWFARYDDFGRFAPDDFNGICEYVERKSRE